MKLPQFVFVICLAALFVAGCADPRTVPPTVSEPAYTETITLWERVVSGGAPQSATFRVDSLLESARLTLAGFIVPDDDIAWFETLINDSFPAKANQITGYLVGLDTLGPDSTWSHEDSLIGVALRDSLSQAVIETTAMGERRDSLIVVVDNRFVFSLWLDVDTTARYPEAVFLDEEATVVSGQSFYASPTDSSGMKGRSFQLRMRQWNAADPANVGRYIELNWLSRLTPGSHTLRAKLTESGSKITGTIVLVYSEGEL
ncbi:MAG: hypothetical protein V1784_07060 [bacterium]